MIWNDIKKVGNPKISNDYLIWTNENYMYVASWINISKNFWTWKIRCECCDAEDCLLTNDMITHWAELPNNPKENI
jgi:hypothetical protein